ncbi:cupin domain-containing protein [Actinoplanes siamensis]|uniref:Cupin type-2 domain-containing protein n=1 Tax=Actinoplanes siamensis TaxID=1223317 RepID=A0A919N705_9ACTN|nr:cupin domain-containing protein [Actinoplanes siamensis]GIF05510.1 hypothetical protein Asi03nite_30480 [Actinoplanes siamensis]
MSSYFRIVPEGAVAPAAASREKFQGGVEQAEILDRQRPDGMRGHRFSYQPGGRSNWHVHTGEQALVVVSGRGLIQWWGLDEPRELREGDWVHVEPGIPHWHGATDDSPFVHLAITATGETRWGPAA